MTDYSGVNWRVNYGEIAEREQFRVGYVGQDSYEAYFEVAALTELIDILSTVQPFDIGLIAKGVTLQAQKVDAGHTTAVVIEPLSDINPEQIMRLDLGLVNDLIYALQLFQTNLPEGIAPDDWDFSDLYLFDKGTRTFKEKFLPERLSEEGIADAITEEVAGATAELQGQIVAVTGEVDDIQTLLASGRLSQTALDEAYASKDTQTTVETGRLSDTSLKAIFIAHCVYNTTTSTYPTRVPGAINIFFGPVDPGLLMQPGDYWEPGDATSLASVTAAMQNTGSPLFAATQVAATGNRVSLKLNPIAGSSLGGNFQIL